MEEVKKFVEFEPSKGYNWKIKSTDSDKKVEVDKEKIMQKNCLENALRAMKDFKFELGTPIQEINNEQDAYKMQVNIDLEIVLDTESNPTEYPMYFLF